MLFFRGNADLQWNVVDPALRRRYKPVLASLEILYGETQAEKLVPKVIFVL